MDKIQPPAVAGLFYPADPRQLDAEIESYLIAAGPPTLTRPKALIVPHAGYIYSGPVAAVAYKQLEPVADTISRVVLLAPSHRAAFSGIAVSSADRFRTPLGDIDVDRQALDQISGLPQVRVIDQAFDGEHSIEVHLPFLQHLLHEFLLLPLLVGDTSAEAVQELLELLWGGSETLIVVSSDLSHYLDYASARLLDRQASDAIEALQPEGLQRQSACGRLPIAGLLLAARAHQLQPVTLDLRNSGDTAGTKERVVGYGAYGFA